MNNDPAFSRNLLEQLRHSHRQLSGTQLQANWGLAQLTQQALVQQHRFSIGTLFIDKIGTK